MKQNKQGVPFPGRGQKGAAMILVLCLMMLFLVLAVTTMFSSGVLVGEAKKDRIEKQCMLLAVSISKQMDQEMKENKKYSEDNPVLDMNNFQDMVRAFIDHRVEKKDIKNFEKENIEKWPYYWKKQNAWETNLDHGITGKENRGDAAQVFELRETGDADFPEGYNLSLEVYWTFEDFEDFRLIMKDSKDYYSGILLSVSVICEKGSSSCRVQNYYQLSVSRPNDGQDPEEWQNSSWSWTKVWKEEQS